MDTLQQKLTCLPDVYWVNQESPQVMHVEKEYGAPVTAESLRSFRRSNGRNTYFAAARICCFDDSLHLCILGNNDCCGRLHVTLPTEVNHEGNGI